MDRNRKLLISILALLVLSSVIALVDISMNMQQKRGAGISFSGPRVRPGVGIVRVEGPIQLTGSTGPLTMGRDAEAIIRRLDELERNGDIRAVVLRINSPGGTVGATQEIYQKLWRLRRKNIRLVASMGEIAASGGYYIASACNVIVANQGTLTGSIGVIAASPNLRGLFDKLGINMTVIKSGRYKDILSLYRDITPEERQMIQEIIDGAYRQFLKDVAKGREMSESDIVPIADGRVMSGDTALKYKLVDMIGTFEDAVERARKEAKLDEDAPVYDELKSPVEELLFGMGGRFAGRDVRISPGIGYETNYRIEYRWQP
jgi:protease-4